MHVTKALRHTVKSIQSHTGIDPHLLSCCSLRPGGATAFPCGGADKDCIQLLGRWQSDAMFHCMRIQAATHLHRLSRKMLDHGTFTFAPGAHNKPHALSREAPPDMHALLAHEGLYVD